MDALEAIFFRKSIRTFTPQPISTKSLQIILGAGMSGPNCVNARDWAFLVVQNRETLEQMAQANGKPANPLRGAAAGILVCGDLQRAFPPAQEYWVIDGAIAAQNMTLAAQALGIGSVWLGTWPQMDRVEKQAKLFSLPSHFIPHSILALGYPDPPLIPSLSGELPATLTAAMEIKWEADRVHWEAWGTPFPSL